MGQWCTFLYLHVCVWSVSTCVISFLKIYSRNELLVQRKRTYDKYIFKIFNMFPSHPNPALRVRNCSSNISVHFACSKKPFLKVKLRKVPSFCLPSTLDFSHPRNYHTVLRLPWTMKEHQTSWGMLESSCSQFSVIHITWMNKKELLIIFPPNNLYS